MMKMYLKMDIVLYGDHTGIDILDGVIDVVTQTIRHNNAKV
jgi:hypothetical protein